jgi:SHS2 domain-containing protein
MNEGERYRYLDHTADIKFEAYGKTYEEVFMNAGYAFENVIIDTDLVEKKIIKKINLSSQDIMSLLYDFLEQLIILIEVEHFVLSEISKVEIDRENNALFVKLVGDEIIEDKYSFKTEVKAVTYNDMKIEKRTDVTGQDFFVATVVVDI